MLIAAVPPSAMPAIRKYGFLIAYTTLLLPFQAKGLMDDGLSPDLAAFFPLAVVFLAVPLLDLLVGRDQHNLNPGEAEVAASDPYFRVVLLLCLPLFYLVLFWSAEAMASLPLGPLGILGWLLSLGTVGGVVAINVGHELIHKPSSIERLAGGLLLSAVGYGTFKVEHVYGHHVDVGTPADASSAERGQSIYAFLAPVYWRNIRRGYGLAAERMKRQGRPWYSWRNEVLWWSLVTLSLACGLTWSFGPLGLLFFVGQGFFAITLLEIVNYIEHYGLRRRQSQDGRYERVKLDHAWNSDYLLGNLYLFQLMRHADHHVHGAKPYQLLRTEADAPQLPLGYAFLVLVALVPPAWFWLMNPRVDAWEARQVKCRSQRV